MAEKQAFNFTQYNVLIFYGITVPYVSKLFPVLNSVFRESILTFKVLHVSFLDVIEKIYLVLIFNIDYSLMKTPLRSNLVFRRCFCPKNKGK